MWLTTLLKELACKNIRSNGHSYHAVSWNLFFRPIFILDESVMLTSTLGTL